MKHLVLVVLTTLVLMACDKSGTQSLDGSATSSSQKISNGKLSADSWTLYNNGFNVYEIGGGFDKTQIAGGLGVHSFNVSKKDSLGNASKTQAHVLVDQDKNNLASISMDPYNLQIEVISIKSPEYKTAEGIGVSNTLSDFIQEYPDYKIYFERSNTMIYVSSPLYPDVRFALDQQAYTGGADKLGTSEKAKLDYTDFLAITEITEIYYQ